MTAPGNAYVAWDAPMVRDGSLAGLFRATRCERHSEFRARMKFRPPPSARSSPAPSEEIAIVELQRASDAINKLSAVHAFHQNLPSHSPNSDKSQGGGGLFMRWRAPG